MDDNVFAVILAVFHVILAAMLHGRRAPTGVTGRRNARRPKNGTPIRPGVQIGKLMKP